MATTISRLAERVVDDLVTDFPAMFQQISKAAYINALQQALIDIVDTDIELSTVTPDYESLMLRLIQALSSVPEWSDLITSTTGHAILRSISSNAAYSQFSIERAYQEAFISTAASTTSIYAAIRMLGIRPQRRQPARVSVSLTRTTVDSIVTIPAYSIFTINGLKFFNRAAIVFNKNVFTVITPMFQGVLQNTTISSDNEPFQKYNIGDGDFTASDIDVILTVDGVEWTRSVSGLYSLGREALTYDENTSSKGDIEINFGNGDFGKIPPISSQVNVLWVKTLGIDGNISTSGLAVTMDTLPQGLTLSGVTTTNVEAGAERITTDIYKKIGPQLRAADGRAVRRSDYKVQALKFEGVYDALFLGQAELAPGRRSMMNTIGYTLLTDENWTLANYQNFEDYFQENLGIFQCEFLRINPVKVVENLTAYIFCIPSADLGQVKEKLTENINALFAPRENFLGRSIYKSDIDDVLNGRNSEDPDEKLEQDVSYVQMDPSVVDMILTSKKQYLALGTLNLVMAYTTRDGYSGRLDIAPNQANVTVIT